jgi:hypothetical protein
MFSFIHRQTYTHTHILVYILTYLHTVIYVLACILTDCAECSDRHTSF